MLFRCKEQKRFLELSREESLFLRDILLRFRSKCLAAGKPTEDIDALLVKVMKAK